MLWERFSCGGSSLVVLQHKSSLATTLLSGLPASLLGNSSLGSSHGGSPPAIWKSEQVCECAEVIATLLYMELCIEYEESEVYYGISQSERVHVWTYWYGSEPCFDNTYSLQKAYYIHTDKVVFVSALF